MSRRLSRRGLLSASEPGAAIRVYRAMVLRALDATYGIILQVVLPLLAVWPGRDRQDAPAINPGPLAPRLPWRAVTDAELRRLWPDTAPADIRAWAPWATSHEAVARLALAPGRPIEGPLEQYVAAAIRAARARGVRPDPHTGSPVIVRGEDAFIARFRRQLEATPPVIYDATGRPLLPPPAPTRVTAAAIRESFGWAELATHQVVSAETLSGMLDRTGRMVDGRAAESLRRVIPIDIRRNRPDIAVQLGAWRDLNVGLIESSLLGARDGVSLRGSLPDVSRLMEEAHADGLRVEEIAGRLIEQYGVDASRAELIARDQVLKLNAQIREYQMRAAGVTRYRWVATMDERTRDAHHDLHDTIHAWDDPPEVAPGRYAHPGQDFQCRCTSEPIIDWLEEG